MPVEIVAPFTLDVTGQIATTSDQQVQAQQHIESLVSTNPGERVMLPDYGVPLKSYLFAPGENLVDDQIVNDVKTQMREWEPNIVVVGVAPIPSKQAGLANVDVTWKFSPAIATATRRAVIQIGGTVTAD